MSKFILCTIISTLLALAAPALPASAQVSFGDASKFNDGWCFLLGNDSTAYAAQYDDTGWRPLSLPHDWSVEGQYSPTLASCTAYLLAV